MTNTCDIEMVMLQKLTHYVHVVARHSTCNSDMAKTMNSSNMLFLLQTLHIQPSTETFVPADCVVALETGVTNRIS